MKTSVDKQYIKRMITNSLILSTKKKELGKREYSIDVLHKLVVMYVYAQSSTKF